jgi:hypothetical protein
MKAFLDLPEFHARALKVILECVPPREIRWALTGSAGLRLQGVDLSVHDLDIQSDERNVYVIEKRLAEYVKTLVHLWESPHMRSLDGEAEIQGVDCWRISAIGCRTVLGAHLQTFPAWFGWTGTVSACRSFRWKTRPRLTSPWVGPKKLRKSVGRSAN